MDEEKEPVTVAEYEGTKVEWIEGFGYTFTCGVEGDQAYVYTFFATDDVLHETGDGMRELRLITRKLLDKARKELEYF